MARFLLDGAKREIMNANFNVLRSGCAWRMVSKDSASDRGPRLITSISPRSPTRDP